MKELITLCGDDCLKCPRYNAKTDDELNAVAEMWYRIGWRDSILPGAEMRCVGCSSEKKCTYGLVECTALHDVARCSECVEFPCFRIDKLLERSSLYEKRCAEVCSNRELEVLREAFFNKEINLKK